MVRMKLTLDNPDNKLEYTSQVYDLAYRAGTDEVAATGEMDPEAYAVYVAERAARSSGVIKHWVDLTDEATAEAAPDMYMEAFFAGYTQATQDARAVSVPLNEPNLDSVKLFIDPWTNTWAYVLHVVHQGVMLESDVVKDFESKREALAHATKTYITEVPR